MKKDILTEKIENFLNDEKTGEGKTLSKAFREGLTKFTFETLSNEIKDLNDSVPLKESVPEASANIVSKFPFSLGKEVFYVIFKNVKTQSKTSIQQTWGWKYTVLKGKTEEIQIRTDHGVIYKINGDWVLMDLIFNSESKALERCNVLNEGVQ